MEFVSLRKKGKLPGETISESYTLEYGITEIEVQTSALSQGNRIFLIGDLITTGGAMFEASNLLKKLGVKSSKLSPLLTYPTWVTVKKLNDAGLTVHTFCEFEGD